jgi:hypothetical protein
MCFWWLMRLVHQGNATGARTKIQMQIVHVTLGLENSPPAVPILSEAEWAPKPFWTMYRREMSLTAFRFLLWPLSCYKVWLWAMFPTFRRYMLPPSSGSECIRWESFCICVELCFEKQREKGDLLPPSGAVGAVDQWPVFS